MSQDKISSKTRKKLPRYNAFQGFPTITPTNAEEFNLVRTRVILGDLTHQRTA